MTSESPQRPDFKGRKIPPKFPKNRIFTLALAISVLPAPPVRADDLVGQASVIDGDTIEIHGNRIRLWGIDAPESDQLCRNDDSKQYRYGRTVATCSLGTPGPDIGHWLVANGHALDWPKYSKGEYEDAQRNAEKANRGIWAGSFVEPWQYRACVRDGGRPATCSDEANDRR